MKIDLATLKRIAKQTPELTIAQFVSVWSEKLEDQRRETEAKRLADKRAKETNSDQQQTNNEQHPPTYEQRESALYALAKQVTRSSRAGGLVTDLLRQHGRDLDVVFAVIKQAEGKHDPKAYLASCIRKPANGTGNSVVGTAERLIAAEKVRTGGDDGPLLDLTPTGSRTG